MKQLFTTFLAVIVIVQFSYGQWTGGPTGSIYYNGGNIGIGTSTPNYSLTLNSSAETGILTIDNGQSLYISHGGWSIGAGKLGIGNPYTPTLVVNTIANGGSSVGNVGIGTINPVSALNVVRGGTNPSTDYSSVVVSTTGTGNIYGPILYLNGTSGTNGRQWGIVSSGALDAAATGTAGNFAIFDATSNSSRLVINSSGYIGIGTKTPKEMLSVNGRIRSQEVKVETSNWPDFVFKKEYMLPSLLEVKKYIDQNHHLPDLPSEKEVMDNGLNLGEINKILTKKVEELTLYLIEKDKQVIEQRKRNEQQDARIAALERALSKITQFK